MSGCGIFLDRFYCLWGCLSYSSPLSFQVLSSSTDLMFYFKTVMKVCSQLSKRQAFFDVSKLFKKYLHEYAKVLSDKVPR